MKKTSPEHLAELLNIHPARGLEAVLKAKLIASITRAIKAKKLSHAELAKSSGIPRSALTGILSRNLQQISIENVIGLSDVAFSMETP